MPSSHSPPPISHGAYAVARASFGTVIAVGSILFIMSIVLQQPWIVVFGAIIGIFGASLGYLLWTKGYYALATSINAGGLILCGCYVYIVTNTLGGATGILLLASVITAGGLLGKKGVLIDILVCLLLLSVISLGMGSEIQEWLEITPPPPPPEEHLLQLFVLTSLPCWGIYVVAIDASNRAAWQKYFLINQQLLEHQKKITEAKQQQEDIAHLGLITTGDTTLEEIEAKCWQLIVKNIPNAIENWKHFTEQDRITEKKLQQISLSVSTHQLFLSSLLQVLRARTQRELILQEQGKLRNRLQKEEKLESLARMAGGVAHDFNNALSVIVSVSDAFASDANLPIHVRSGAETILEATRHASELTKQLLLFAQGIPPTYTPINPVIVLQELLPILRHIVGNKATLEIDTVTTSHLLNIPKENLERIFMNLIQNSIDAIKEKGEIRLSIQEEHNPSSQWIICVQDDGIGMPQSILDRAIEPYFSSKEGTGLGLSTIHGLIDQVNGSLEINSAINNGTLVTIKIPFTETRQEEQSPLSLHIPKEKTVLLIDDEPFVRTAIEMFLQRLGWNVFSADSRKNAMKYVQNAISLIVCDIRLVDDNGFSVVKELESNGLVAPVLYVTGYAGTEKLHNYQNACLLIKPFRLADLERSIENALRQYQESVPCL